MAHTFEDVCEQLTNLDEVTLVETLELTSKEIVEAFKDKIEINYREVYYKVTGEDLEEEGEDE